MPVQLSLSSFAGLLRRSSLIDPKEVDRLVGEFRKLGGKTASGADLASWLVERGALTDWQAKKLLQGKTRGFRLGKYRLLSRLGKGGMSTVYLAEHLVMRRRCAIKVLPTKLRDPSALGRFHREAQAVAALDHPNIVRAYDVDSEVEAGTEIHFLVMEYVDGPNLQVVVDQNGPLPVAVAADYARQGAEGLAHAHQAGLIHRDIKPTNLLVDASGTVKLLDLGLARFFDESDETSLTIDHNQRVLGTADYLSPEQAVDSHKVDARADIYSLGCTFYFLLTGHAPFPQGTLAQRLLAHQTKQPPPITADRDDVPPQILETIARMMAKDPRQRFVSAAAVCKALAERLAELGESSLPNKIRLDQSPRVNSKNSLSSSTLSATSPPSAETVAGLMTPPATIEPTEAGFGEFLAQLDSKVETKLDSSALGRADTVISDRKPVAVKQTRVEEESVLAAEPDALVTDSSLSPSDVSGTLQKRKAERFRQRIAVLFSVAVAFVMTAAAIALLLPSDATDQRQQVEDASGAGGEPTDAAPTTARSSAEAAASRPAPEPGGDVLVGPDGHFATIQEALDYVRDHYRLRNDAPTIRVAGGVTYAEGVSIDNSQFGAFPQGVELICEDDSPAILAPGGDDPVIDLRDVERFTLRGFVVRGGGRPVTIHLQGYLSRLRLRDLSVEGFSSVGLLGQGVMGFARAANRVELRELRFHPASPSAVGMRFDSGDTPSQELLIQRCRLLGEMKAGLQFTSDVSLTEIRECLFDKLGSGILFGGFRPEISEITLANNTFHSLERGVAFTSLPSDVSGKIRFERNLFAGVRESEAIVESAGEGDWTSIFAETLDTSTLNWSDRPAPASAPEGELDLFRNDGRRGATVSFLSTDPSRPNYLKPSGTELTEAVPPNRSGLKFIGAVNPR